MLDDKSDQDSVLSDSGFSTEPEPRDSFSRDEVEEVKKIIRQETKIVAVWRWVVAIAILAVGAVVTGATYIFLSSQEEEDFETHFDELATTLIDSSRFSASAIKSGCNDFADQLTSHGLAEGAQWPFVTLPYFDVHGKNLREQSGSVGFWLMPYVQTEERQAWAQYTMANGGWYGQRFSPLIFTAEANGTLVFDHPGPYLPLWQMDPVPVQAFINFDMNVFDLVQQRSGISRELGEGVFGDMYSALGGIFATSNTTNDNDTEETGDDAASSADEPQSAYYQPVFDSFDETTRKVAGFLLVFLRWQTYFSDKLPEDTPPIHLVLDSSPCNSTSTWEIAGRKAVHLARKDLHDQAYNKFVKTSGFNFFNNEQRARELGACFFSVSVYPSAEFEEAHKSNTPVVLAAVVGAVFLSIVIAFFAYDTFQRRRNQKIIVNAARSNALVTSLFPVNAMRERVLQPEETDTPNPAPSKGSTFLSRKGQLMDFLDKGNTSPNDKPIADLFLETTLIFADIVGFTAWSSSREPSQVFTLLETIFSSLDRLAKKRRVFKVETVGDCYVGITGLLEKRKDHAVIMAKFAREALMKVQDLFKRLEMTLGPDTADLGIRIGVHSGVVTAGVLRGERSRFQLFGDTVNTCSRIESTGKRNRIHISKETAELLVEAGKEHWVVPRRDVVSAKGKGDLETFWLEIKDANNPSSVPELGLGGEQDVWGDAEVAESKVDRLIDWQVDVFTHLLKQVVARRAASPNDVTVSKEVLDRTGKADRYCLGEVKEIITLPEFDAQAFKKQDDPEAIQLPRQVTDQLRQYVQAVAKLYRRENDFHNFEHCCHVTMSVTKLLSRIIMPSEIEIAEDGSATGKRSSSEPNLASSLHDHTYGITSDPLTQFSLVFSALVHDVGHSGVPNTQLIKENQSMAALYKNQSVAEQNSVSLAWDLLQERRFDDLRACIHSTNAEFERFRQLVVQAVLATDIVDSELKTLRNSRWDAAFTETTKEENPRDKVNRKATIVIEHLIQASDVAHTMQHWHVYRKWNQNFFRECYKAYKEGRADTDPSIGWYKGELGFFDFYIIPLAKKLKKCGVFGVSSDEYLSYAMQNRQEWRDRGQMVVAEMLQEVTASDAAAEGGKDGQSLHQTKADEVTHDASEDFYDESPAVC